ncbi:MAG TPA: hypothetical protein VIL18_10785 [Longimicrobiales bacterium]
MRPQVRPPEWVLEEMYKTGRRWMAARARVRRHGGNVFGEASAGDHPPAYANPQAAERAAEDADTLRRRFEELADEFISTVEGQ